MKWNDQVDKKSLSALAAPLQDALAKDLGPYAVQWLT